MKHVLIALAFAVSTLRAAVSVYSGAEALPASYITGAAQAVAAGTLVFGDLGATSDPAWAGKVVLLDRGTIDYLTKLNNAKAAGALAVIIANNTGSGIFAGTLGTGNTSDLTAVNISRDDGTKLKGRLGSKVHIGATPPPQVASDPFKVEVLLGSYQVRAEDAGKMMAIRSLGAPYDWTIPNDATVDLPVSFRIYGASIGDGPVTIVPMEGVTLISVNGARKALDKGARWEAVKLGPNNWLIDGKLEYSGPLPAVRVGRKVVLNAEYSWCDPKPAFEWKKDGAVLAGETNVSLLLHNVTLADAGTYSVTVKNEAGEVSADHVLEVSETAPIL